MRLPDSISTFFAAVGTNPGAAAALFAPDAEVIDDGHTFRGTADVRRWSAEHLTGISAEVVDTTRSGEHLTATARITGDFPGSPLMFDFRFAGDDELTTISELLITPRP